MGDIRKKIKLAEEMKKERMKEMKPYLQEIGRQQRKKQFANSLLEEKEKSGTAIMHKKNSGEL